MKNNGTEKKILFHVYSEGRKLQGEFGSKQAAKKFRDNHNATLEKGEHPWWVSPGKDHWRWNTDRTIPTRPPADIVPFVPHQERLAREAAEGLQAA